MSQYKKPLPRIYEGTVEFWEGCKKHELLIQRCRDCNRYRYPYQPMCPECNSLNAEWTRVDGKGKIYSFAVAYNRGDPSVRYPLKGYEDEYPYAIVLVELDNIGVRMISNVTNCSPGDLKIGMPVEVTFADVTDKITLPLFRPLK